MHVSEILFIGFALSMDAFAVAVSKGACMNGFRWREALSLALLFGLFQAGMPLIGYLVGSTFQQAIERVDHWIAFGLLAFLGGKMAFEALKKDDSEAPACTRFSLREGLLLALATSIDALAVGVVFAVAKSPILSAVFLIGCETFAISLAGVALGRRVGQVFKDKAALVGGLVLIGIGVKILLERLFFA